MDNLTHGLTGAALSRAGLDRTTPLATATLVVAANAPDVDMLSYLGGTYFALAFRRGITHGLPAMVVLPFAVAGVMLAWDRAVRLRRRPDATPARFLPLLALSAIGLLTHPVLDWMNTYGMRWLLPFDGAWSYGDALFIIDPWLWLLLGAAVFVPRRWCGAGYVGWGMLCVAASALILLAPVATAVKVVWSAGVAAVAVWHAVTRPARVPADAWRDRVAGGTPPIRRRPARVLLAVATVYVAALVLADGAARTDVREAARAVGLEPVDVLVSPAPGNPLAADVEVLTADGYVPGEHRWTDTPRVLLRPEERVPLLTGAGIPDSVLGPVLEAARAVPDARHYLVWSRYPWTRVTPAPEGGWSVRFGDARYDGRDAAGSLGGVTVRVGPDAVAPERVDPGSRGDAPGVDGSG